MPVEPNTILLVVNSGLLVYAVKKLVTTVASHDKSITTLTTRCEIFHGDDDSHPTRRKTDLKVM